MDEKYEILQEGNTVVDLGAAPGGWLQIAKEKVGKNGSLLGIDLDEIEKIESSNVKTITADITEPKTVERIKQTLSQKPDAIISDASPNITGTWSIDHARSIDLGKSCLSIAEKTLKPGGNLLMKIFQGEYFTDLLNEAKEKFQFCKSSKPKASRDESAEIYIVGKDFQA